MISLSGTDEAFSGNITFQFRDPNNVSYKLEQTDEKDGQGNKYLYKLIVKNSVTKVQEIYYIQYHEYVPDFYMYNITAADNNKISWENSEISDAAGGKRSVLTITGQALTLKDPTFIFDESGIVSKYEESDVLGYDGKLTATFNDKHTKIFYVTYGSLLEPTDAEDTENAINDWYVEYNKTGDQKTNDIHIYVQAENAEFTSGSALQFRYPEGITGTYTPSENPEADGYAGKLIVNGTKEYFVKYHTGFPEIFLQGVLEKGNTINDITVETNTSGEAKKIYNIKGSKQNLRTGSSLEDVTFWFNVSVKTVEVTPADSSDSAWDYKLKVTTYKKQSQDIYIKYTKST